MTELYYEAHITIKAQAARYADFAALCSYNTWKPSMFEQDEFASFRHCCLSTIYSELSAFKTVLTLNGYEVIRYKLEDIIVDSKHGDVDQQLYKLISTEQAKKQAISEAFEVLEQQGYLAVADKLRAAYQWLTTQDSQVSAEPDQD